MKLENQVVSLKLAKELKKAGFPQDTQWCWIKINIVPHYELHLRRKIMWNGTEGNVEISGEKYNISDCVAAPTVAELGEALKHWALPYLSYHFKKDTYCFRSKDKYNYFDTEAAARATAWLYLKKEKLL